MPNLKGNQLKRNAVLNVVKQLAAIIFPMITFPYVSRVLGAEGYGKINFTASIISYISLIAGLGINNYAIREGSRLKGNKEQFEIFIKEIFTLNCLAMIFAYVILAFIILFWADAYKVLLIIQGITVFFNVIGCEWLNVIYEDYVFITIRYIVLQFIAVLLMIAFVKSEQDIYLYALISQIAIVFTSILNIVHFMTRWRIRVSFKWNNHIFVHLKYVLILFGNAVSMLIYVNSDITLIGIFCGEADVGIYSVAVKIYTIIKQLLNALMIVGVPRMARWTGTRSKDETDNQLNAILETMLCFLIPCIVGLVILSKSIIYMLAGSGYELARSALQILALTLFFSTGVCFYSDLVLIPNNMEKHILKATIISAALNIVLNLVFIPRYGLIAAACTTLLSEFTTVLYMIVVTKKLYFPAVKDSFIASVFSGLLVLGCCGAVSKFVSNDIIRVIISVFTSAAVWGIYMFRRSFLKRNNKKINS